MSVLIYTNETVIHHQASRGYNGSVTVHVAIMICMVLSAVTLCSVWQFFFVFLKTLQVNNGIVQWGAPSGWRVGHSSLQFGPTHNATFASPKCCAENSLYFKTGFPAILIAISTLFLIVFPLILICATYQVERALLNNRNNYV